MINPYLQKSFESIRMFIAGFLLLMILIVASCSPEPAYATTEAKLPVTCFTVEEFTRDYKSKQFEIVSKSTAVIFSNGNAVRLDKIITRGGENVIGTWLVEKGGDICLLFMENGTKVVSY